MYLSRVPSLSVDELTSGESWTWCISNDSVCDVEVGMIISGALVMAPSE